MIEISNLSYSYPRAAKPALLDITTKIDRGEFILLAGPSGAGKSTLLRSLNGLVPHYSGGTASGRVVVDGIDVFAGGPKKLSSVVGFVFQDPEAQNVLDIVEDELAFGMENAAVPSEEMHQRIGDVLDVLEMTSMRDRQISTLSGGERQRLAIASVLIMKPRVIALDEPTSQLDPQSASELLRYLVRLNDEWELTIVMVEHRLERVARYADRLLYLKDGRLKVDEPVEQGLAQLDPEQGPPLARLSQTMGWDPMPMTTREGSEQSSLSGLDAPNIDTGQEGQRPAANASLLQTLDLHFSYGETAILKGVFLEIRAGEAVALVGRNGSGKSTLLQCLVGLLIPSNGEILLDGESIVGHEVSDICQDIAFLPQNPDDLLFADSVAEELDITLKNHCLNPEQLAQSPEELLDKLDLSDCASSYPRDLSAGQRQRVALGAVIVPEPRIVLLDEPTRGLDYSSKSRLMEIWKQWREDGIGFLLVTHDVELVARACDRVMVLDRGIITADGPTAEVLDSHPIFRPQLARLFPGYGWMTVNDAADGISQQLG
ncbi:MAG TPA: energy-coupling factor transporter ATPase [candidate division Zixibacteria bacterium]|nr:energy-coupling factor transporter ATPase [candidate division Zixibacteria bacterium]